MGTALWRHLEFKNLPGRLDRAPSFNSPYHYRLDWEVWIHTTASMEGGPGGPGLPPIVESLVSKLLAGDTQAAGLLGTPRSELYVNGSSPTAIRSSYHLYSFSDWESLSQRGEWWRRAEVPGARQIFTAKNRAWQGPVSKDPEERQWLLFLSALGTFMGVHTILDDSMSSHLWHVLVALTSAGVFV